MDLILHEMKKELRDLQVMIPQQKRITRNAQSRWDHAKNHDYSFSSKETREALFTFNNYHLQDARTFARYLNLAYAFYRGVPYAAVENYSHNVPDAEHVLDMLKYFGMHGFNEGEVLFWIEDDAYDMALEA